MADLPVIVLAFANEQEGQRYLRDLPNELRRLQTILEATERQGLCKLVVRPNASLQQIFDTFTEHRDRVAILHYGGHAGSDRLFLEMASPGHDGVAHAEGLTTFIGHRRNLQLVFLNGCSTRAMAAGLLDAGVGSVIATDRAIEDAVARDFAVGFYAELASGATLRASYESARGRLLAARGNSPRAYFRTRDLVALVSDDNLERPAHTDERGFPWEFRLAPGAELDRRWSLPEAAGNPLFGLPSPSVDWLPETPYRGLERFTRDEAAVFFGRGRAIRELYGLATDPGTRPVILYYGPTGVGKSSVLDAGLGPRLTFSREVLYFRREPDLGLLDTLRRGLSPAGPGTYPSSPADLARLWCDRERPDRPLVAILDQAEEAFTRPHVFVPSADNPEALGRPWIDPDAELAELLSALRATFANPDPAARPRGKLILGFRNEWLDRFEQAFNAVKLGWEPMPLKPLDRAAIVEAIEGPGRDPALIRRYGLTVEDGLAASIAEDLVVDAGSAVAPTLQVLLTDMWRRSGGKGSRFDQLLYKRLRDEGYLLGDVLDKGLEAVRGWRRDAEESGLALDVLAFHVTVVDSAATRTRTELEARYAHQADLLPGLLARLVDGYLLIAADARAGPESPGVPAIRLAHDTLGPLVHSRFRASVAPGQRARRLLENRALEWQGGKTGHILDTPDLQAVDDGKLGMRAWTADEIRLFEASRHAEDERRLREREQKARDEEQSRRLRDAEAKAKEETERRLKEQGEANRQLRESAVRLRRTVAFTAVVALVAIFTALWAVQKTREALKATELAEQRLKTSTSRRLAALSTFERNRRLDVSLLLAVEAFRTESTFEARDSLYKAVKERPELICFLNMNAAEGTIRNVAFSPDGRTLAVAFDRGVAGGGVVLWDTASRSRQSGPLEVKEGQVLSIAFSPDGRTLAAGFGGVGGGGVVLWDTASRSRLSGPLGVKEGTVNSVAFGGPDGRTLAGGFIGVAIGGGDGGVVLWDAGSRSRLSGPLEVKEGTVHDVAFSPDGRTIAAGLGIGVAGNGSAGDGGVVLWDLTSLARLASPLLVKEGRVLSVAFDPGGRTLAAGFIGINGGGVILWDAASRNRLSEPLEVKEGFVVDVAFGPGGQTLAGSFVGVVDGVVLWDAASRNRLSSPLEVKEGRVSNVAFDPGGLILAAGFSGFVGGGGVVLGDTASRSRLSEPLEVKEGILYDVAFDPGSRTIAAGFGDGFEGGSGGMVLWDAASRRRLSGPLAVKEGQVVSVAFGPGGRSIAAGYGGLRTAGYDGFAGGGGVVLWDTASRSRVSGPLEVKEGQVLSVAFNPVSGTIAGGFGVGLVGGVVLWDAASRARVSSPLEVKEGTVHDVAFSPDGRTLAAGFGGVSGVGDGGVVLWDAMSRARVSGPLVVKEGTVHDVAFSPDGRTLAAGYGGLGGGGVVLWDAASRSRLSGPLEVKEGTVDSVAFDLEGRTLAAGYGGLGGGGVVLWDTASRARLSGPLEVREGQVNGLAFGSDGRILAAGRLGVSLWDVDLESWQRLAVRIANRNLSLGEFREYFPEEHAYHPTIPELPTPP